MFYLLVKYYIEPLQVEKSIFHKRGEQSTTQCADQELPQSSVEAAIYKLTHIALSHLFCDRAISQDM